MAQPWDARTCPRCGVDLSVFALLAERAYLEGVPQAAPINTIPEAIVPRIGEYLIELLQTALITALMLIIAGSYTLLPPVLGNKYSGIFAFDLAYLWAAHSFGSRNGSRRPFLDDRLADSQASATDTVVKDHASPAQGLGDLSPGRSSPSEKEAAHRQLRWRVPTISKPSWPIGRVCER